MAFEWVAGLFQSEEARGLSGESASSVALDESNPYYNYRLRRHITEGDLIADPGLLWYTSPYVTQRQGLGTHVGAEPSEGVANYTDVLLILSEEDHDRAQAAGEQWSTNLQRTLQQEFENHCRRENLQRPHAHRPLGFKILRDGSPGMHGLSLGLQHGEFVTGLLPNLYTGPVRGSYAVIGVHVNLPGVWEGYREVGRLHNDQILFTLGNHWLDNYSHPALSEAALYRLQQYPDGNFVHIVNPDLQDRYQVTSTVQNNASVLTLATNEGRPLAYLVLAVMEPPATPPEPEPQTRSAPSMPRINLPDAPTRPPAQEAGSDFDHPIPSVAPPMLIDDEVQPVVSSMPSLGGKTIIPDAPSERIFTLQERGALLQKVHFSAFMLGYDVYMGARGELGTKVENPAASFQVRKRSTSLVAHVPGVEVGGMPVPVGEQIPLDGDTTIVMGDTRLEYRDLRAHLSETGWPYVAEIRRPTSSTYLIWGEEYQVGRSRECRVVLPDQTSNDNIHWKPKVGDGAYIRARTGDIPKANFYTDSIMVSSEHATIDLSGNEPKVQCTASHCYVFVRRNGEILSLYPTSKDSELHELPVEPGDEVLIGNCLFQVGYSSGAGNIAPAPAPEVQLSADSLADAVPEPDFSEGTPSEAEDAVDDVPEAAPPPPPPPPEPEPEAASEAETEAIAGPPTGDDEADDSPEQAETAMWEIPSREVEDAPAAGGLGESGSEPEPVPVRNMGGDSILGSLDDVMSNGEGKQVEATFNSELGDPDDIDDLPLVDPAADVGGWDEEDFSVELTQPPPPPEEDEEVDDAPSMSVPKPFPELEEEASDGGGEEPEDAPADADAAAAAEEDEPEAEEAAPEAEEDAEEPVAEDDDSPPPAPEAEQPEAEEAAPEPEAEASAEEPPPAPAPAAREVRYTDDAEAQFELGRPCHVILAGWMLNGEAVIGNHSDADLVLPENRILETQTFEPRDYLRMKVRGRKGSMEILPPTEVLIDEYDPEREAYDNVEGHTIDVIRRDEEGEEDFAIRLVVQQDKKLPDPRARLVALDYEDPLAAALVTRGLPLGTPRTIDMAPIRLTLTWDGEQVTVSDYGESYANPEGGFHPFFVQSGGKRFTTAPEDGSSFQLAPGDRFVVGQAVYVVREE